MTAYDRLRTERPELFGNDPEGIDILLDPAEVEEARRAVGTDEPVGVVYADRYVTLLRDAVRFPGGALGLYVRLVHTESSPGVVVLPLVGGDRIVLVEHYRHATRAWHWELPRGMAAREDTSGEDNAVRELREELGVVARELIPLGPVHPDTGLLGGCVEMYAARVDGVGVLDAAEGIRRAVARPWWEVERMIASGEVSDGFTIAAFTRARLAGLFTGRQPSA
ncbi:NUDIX hydrolase [Streptomyces sp. NPDC004609]|uniref:NUDIX hydrolase n=1 Tax=Streptomyces sp. NPDC004609 TaxID=3364704 RepID=UPI00369CF316